MGYLRHRHWIMRIGRLSTSKGAIAFALNLTAPARLSGNCLEIIHFKTQITST
jgi:hypothetical protein